LNKKRGPRIVIDWPQKKKRKENEKKKVASPWGEKWGEFLERGGEPPFEEKGVPVRY